MGRRRRKKGGLLDILVDLAPSVILLVFLYLWFKFGNLTVPVVVIGLIAILILGSAFYFFRRHKKKLMESGIGLIDEMSGTVFEELLMEHFKRLGYRAKMTAKTGDYGADLILEKEEERIVVQAKRWKQNVGVAAIQQVVGAINYYHADKGMVISNSYFTSNAEKLARSNSIELWDRDKLVDFLSKARGKQLSEEIIDKSQREGQICPRCGNRMVLRDGKYGKFWGCENFPRCRFTKPCNE
ncbi:MAG: restriction endonuclease [Firmicutes bacterium]|nr:restriction endonuclease [Bacillota bacterium]